MKSKRNQQKNPIHPRLVAYTAAAGAALAATATTAPEAKADVVYSGPTSISIPATFAGLYINFVTGAYSGTASSVPGYDFDPYSSNGLAFYFPTGSGGVYDGTAFENLAPGTLIYSGSTFQGSANSGASMVNYQVSGTELLGVEFVNENTGATNYGWVSINTTAATGFPATITGYAYENTGAGIMAGQTSSVPEPTTMATLGLGVLCLGAAGIRRWRKTKQAIA